MRSLTERRRGPGPLRITFERAERARGDSPSVKRRRGGGQYCDVGHLEEGSNGGHKYISCLRYMSILTVSYLTSHVTHSNLLFLSPHPHSPSQQTSSSKERSESPLRPPIQQLPQLSHTQLESFALKPFWPDIHRISAEHAVLGDGLVPEGLGSASVQSHAAGGNIPSRPCLPPRQS